MILRVCVRESLPFECVCVHSFVYVHKCLWWTQGCLMFLMMCAIIKHSLKICCSFDSPTLRLCYQASQPTQQFQYVFVFMRLCAYVNVSMWVCRCVNTFNMKLSHHCEQNANKINLLHCTHKSYDEPILYP